MNKQEAKEIYFKFYDLLPKDIGDRAKEYFLSTNRKFFNKPVDVSGAIIFGFIWTGTEEGQFYWETTAEKFNGVGLTDSSSSTNSDPFLYYLEGVYDGLGGEGVEQGQDMLVDVVRTIISKYKQLKH